MRKIVICLVAILSITLLVCTGCSNKIPEKPDDTTLEFWIAQDVSSVDFSDYFEVSGWFGAQQFYGKGYYPEEVDDGDFVEPKYCVKYLVRAYPDTSDRGQFITRIDITDPNVCIYGISCNSSLDEFDEALSKVGYKITENSTTMHTATLGKVSLYLKTIEKNQLTISVEVTNRTGRDY